jgi:hypothetical protein
MKISPSNAKSGEFLRAEADLAIERNQAMTSGKGRYRADHHAELITVCALLRDELNRIEGLANNDTWHDVPEEHQEQMHNPKRDYAAMGLGIIRPHRERSPR